MHDGLGLSSTGGAIYPVFINPKKSVRLDDVWAKANGLPSIKSTGVTGFWDEHQQQILALNQSVDSVVIVDDHQGQEMMVVFDPALIRSVNASFRPEDVGQDHLLGHRHDHVLAPEKAVTKEPLSPTWVKVMSLFEQYLQDPVLSLREPPLIKAMVESLGDLSAQWHRRDKLKLLRRMGDSDYKALSFSEKAEDLSRLCLSVTQERSQNWVPEHTNEEVPARLRR